MLARLWHDAVVGRDHHERKIDAGGAGQHGVDEFLVAGHVDEAQHRAIRRRQIGKAKLDGDAARLLFLETIGVDAGQRANQRCLTVVDVAGGADDHAATFGKGCAARSSASRSSTGLSVDLTGSKNGSASVLPPLRARSSRAKAATLSCFTPEPR